MFNIGWGAAVGVKHGVTVEIVFVLSVVVFFKSYVWVVTDTVVLPPRERSEGRPSEVPVISCYPRLVYRADLSLSGTDCDEMPESVSGAYLYSLSMSGTAEESESSSGRGVRFKTKLMVHHTPASSSNFGEGRKIDPLRCL